MQVAETGEETAVALVIPAYNEAAAIGGVLERARALAARIIVVDDGSTDATWEVAAAHAVTRVRHPANRGKAAALLTGIRLALDAGATWIVTLDADGQHRPEDVPRLLAAARRRPDVIVIGSRRADRGGAPAARYRANRIADFWISWAAGMRLDDSQSGFRVYPAAVLRRLLPASAGAHGFVFESRILIEAGCRGVPVAAVPIPALYAGTTARRSHFRPVRDITRIVLMVAWKLASRGFHPAGLARTRARSGAPAEPAREVAARASTPSRH